MSYFNFACSSNGSNDSAAAHLDNVVIFPDGSVFWTAAELPDPAAAAERAEPPADRSLAALLPNITITFTFRFQ